MHEKEASALRQEVESYLQQHSLQSLLNEAVNEVIRERPDNPLIVLSKALVGASKTAHAIKDVKGSQVMTTSGLPAIDVGITTSMGTFHASVSGGPYDGDEDNFNGHSLNGVIEVVNNLIFDKLEGMNVMQQEDIDKALAQEQQLPATAVLAASMACCKAGARHADVTLAQHVAALSENSDPLVPLPVVSLLNGGTKGAGGDFVQDILLVPDEATSINEALVMTCQVATAFKELLIKQAITNMNFGRTGGLCPSVSSCSFETAMDCAVAAIDAAGYKNRVHICLDLHTSKLFQRRTAEGSEELTSAYALNKYLEGDEEEDEPTLTSKEELTEKYIGWVRKYPIISLIEPYGPVDAETQADLLSQLEPVMEGKRQLQAEEAAAAAAPAAEGDAEEADKAAGEAEEGEPVATGLGGDASCFFEIVGDSQIESFDDISQAIDQRSCNALLLTLKRSPTITDTINLCKRAQASGWGVILSEDDDDGIAGGSAEFLAGLGGGLRVGQIKVGGWGSPETCAMMNELARGAKAGSNEEGRQFAGSKFRACA